MWIKKIIKKKKKKNSYSGFKSKLKQLTVSPWFIKLGKVFQVTCLNGQVRLVEFPRIVIDLYWEEGKRKILCWGVTQENKLTIYTMKGQKESEVDKKNNTMRVLP